MEQSQVSLAYGRQQIRIDIPTRNLMGVYFPVQIAEVIDEESILQKALANPIGTPPLREIVRPGQKIVVVTSDITRPTPSALLINAITVEIRAAGIPNDDVTIALGLGLHRPMTHVEIDEVLTPEIHQRYTVLNHNPDDTIHIGATTRGTPVEIFRPVVEADVRICLGNIEFHYYAGYSGGAKAILPGCASRAAISANHSWLVHPQAIAGQLDDNPVRMDLEEGTAMLGADFILNVVMDSHQKIAAAFSGDLTSAHRLGCAFVQQRGTIKIPRLADIVIASAGGFPKDIDFYQAHKALEIAKYFVREGGIIILVAECTEGYGNSIFEAWMLEQGPTVETTQKIRKGFVLYGHKAAAIAVILERAQIFMVSNLAEQVVCRSHFTPFETPQVALNEALYQLGSQSQVLVLPQAGSILPAIEG